MVKMVKCKCGTRINELNILKHIESSSHKTKILSGFNSIASGLISPDGAIDGRTKRHIYKKIPKHKIILDVCTSEICFIIDFDE